MPEAKVLLRRALDRVNLDVHRRKNVPFGVHYGDDIKHYLRGGMGVAFDVGAHWGETTLKLLQAFPGVEVYSFEPLPESFATLAQVTAGSSVHAVNAAVSDKSGTLTIARDEVTSRAGVDGSGERLEVRAVTVDEQVREHGVERIDLLKIDVEGHEEAVLRGALSQLENGRIEFVVCECDFTARPEEPHADFRALQSLLEPLGYRVVSFYTGGVDNLGWLWGDVLFRYAPGARDHSSWVVSPYRARRAR
jgi:FkbM family methyltransferase